MKEQDGNIRKANRKFENFTNQCDCGRVYNLSGRELK